MRKRLAIRTACLAVLLLCAGLSAREARAATWVVDTVSDSDPLDSTKEKCTSAPNDCSLRGAMLRAEESSNNDVPLEPQTIIFDTAIFSTPQTINLMYGDLSIT